MPITKALPLLLVSTALFAALSPQQFDTIKVLGDLNAVALQCGHLDQTRRIKTALVAHLPKRRELGFAFDQQTHTAFLRFIEDEERCPDAIGFAAEVDAAIERLRQSFAGAKE
ncbi:MAG: hypothetical protein KDI68_07935 [Gammaproteobacteria bacterium]|nr:hypothetical protein [Gammaproteobacteria bacterium]